MTCPKCGYKPKLGRPSQLDPAALRREFKSKPRPRLADLARKYSVTSAAIRAALLRAGLKRSDIRVRG